MDGVLSQEEINALLNNNDAADSDFEHTDIRERFNPQCQRNLCPKWYRKNMVEFT